MPYITLYCPYTSNDFNLVILFMSDDPGFYVFTNKYSVSFLVDFIDNLKSKKTQLGVPETILCHFCVLIQAFIVSAVFWRLLRCELFFFLYFVVCLYLYMLRLI